jgi:hypothetical protein
MLPFEEGLPLGVAEVCDHVSALAGAFQCVGASPTQSFDPDIGVGGTGTLSVLRCQPQVRETSGVVDLLPISPSVPTLCHPEVEPIVLAADVRRCHHRSYDKVMGFWWEMDTAAAADDVRWR